MCSSEKPSKVPVHTANADMYHFVLSLVVLCGAGFLLYLDKGDSMPMVAIGAVLGFWFTRGGAVTGGILVDQTAQHAAQNTAAALSEGKAA